MNQEKIGKYIQEKRKELKLTQLELATRLGISEKTVSNWENGRNMPDLSLFNPLCEELNISINELMKGEKIDNDNYQKVLEENMVNTINYSNKNTNKKLKKITILFITLFVLVIGFIIFYSNKEILINDKDYPIYQEVYIDSRVTNHVIKKYILDNIMMKENENLKNFISFEIFSIEQKKENDYYVYTWILSQIYEKNGKVLFEQGGSSYPCRFELIKENNNYKVIDSDIPRDGGLYVEDLKIYFPKYVRDKIEKIYDGEKSTFDKLKEDNLNQAKDYFNLN